MKSARFVIDTHVHGQRHAVQFDNREEDPNYVNIANAMRGAVPADEDGADDADVIVYKNTDRILYDMDCYEVDMAVLLPGFGMENRLHREMVQDHPDKFVAMCNPVRTMKAAVRGEREYSFDAAAEELDEWLGYDEFVGIGEGLPRDPNQDERLTWRERKAQIEKIFDVAADHDVPIRWHTGRVSGYTGMETPIDYFPDWTDPTLAMDLAAEYPDVDIIFDHGGMQGTWHEDTVDDVCKVAATHDNVHLEIGLYWADLLKKPMNDPNIGIDQLLWGNDWGASMPQYHQPGESPPMYWDQISDWGLPAHQIDYWGASLRQLLKYAMDRDLPQDDLNQILGGNAARLFDLDVPETRLFPDYIKL